MELQCHHRNIAGVKCDCVLKPQPDEWIIVEITEESSLEKVRTDIAKLVTVKQSLFMNNVFARCYFVMKNTPTDSMRAAGDAQKIFVRSAEEFQNEYFNIVITFIPAKRNSLAV